MLYALTSSQRWPGEEEEEMFNEFFNVSYQKLTIISVANLMKKIVRSVRQTYEKEEEKIWKAWKIELVFKVIKINRRCNDDFQTRVL